MITIREPEPFNANVFLILKIKHVILNEYKHFDMEQWDCGTTACIAGWAARLSGLNMNRNHGSVKQLFKLSESQWSRLVYIEEWPESFRSQYERYRTPCKARAQIVADRIDYFLETKGTDDPF